MNKNHHNMEGQVYWRSLGELAESPQVAAALQREFAGYDPGEMLGLSRRRFMKLMAASMALAGLTLSGCRRWPEREVRPHNAQPEGIAPGQAVKYATMMELGGVATGLLVTAMDGRPIKVDGNPLHPYSLGAADVFAQASVLELYDPDRTRRPLRLVGSGQSAMGSGRSNLPTADRRLPTPQGRSWEEFFRGAHRHFDALRDTGGAGLAVLAQPTSSPTLLRVRGEFLKAYPQARWHVYEPLHRDNEIEGTRLAFGRPLRPVLNLRSLTVIACFDADLLGAHPAHQRYARDWAAGRSAVGSGQSNLPTAHRPLPTPVMNRLYACESSFTLTGSVADNRLPVRPSRVGEVLRELARRLAIGEERHEGTEAQRHEGEVSTPLRAFVPAASVPLEPQEQFWVERLTADLKAHGGVVAVGPQQPAEVHALACVVNGAIGKIAERHEGTEAERQERQTSAPLHAFVPDASVPLYYVDEPSAELCLPSIRELAQDVREGRVQTLLILGGNPVYDAPADAGFDLVGPDGRPITAIHLGLHFNETAARCAWHLPMAHYLECWGDGRAWDGTYSVQQPLILPLFQGKSAIELLAELLRLGQTAGRELVRETFSGQVATGGGQREWEKLLHDGVLAGSASRRHEGEIATSLRASVPDAFAPSPTRTLNPFFEAAFVPDPSVYDGRFANNGWLQELPETLTKLAWGNAALISVSDAEQLRLRTGDVVRIAAGDTALELPCYVMPGAAQGTIVLPLGYGRKIAGRVGNGIGVNVHPLRRDGGYVAGGVSVAPTGRRETLALTAEHHLIDAIGMWGREKRAGAAGASGYVVREATLEQFRGNPDIFKSRNPKVSLPQLFDPPHAFNEPHSWGMAVDLNRCIGCNACVVGCQAENNIPIVGPREVANSREMHWLRIDRYFKGPADNPEVVHMPMSCLHCENAPCEQVCPVAATVHDTEGLNTMVYNRCIGTRYCANNCPVKVRRFNYFDYHVADPRGRPRPWLGIPDQQQGEVEELRRMQFNPQVTVRMRGVMEKCTYCTQKIQAAKVAGRVEHAEGRRESDLVQDGELQPACAAACPTTAIVFGDLNDPDSAVSQLRRSNRAYSVLEELNLRPRTQYLAKLRNPTTSRDSEGTGPAQPASSGGQSAADGVQEVQG